MNPSNKLGHVGDRLLLEELRRRQGKAGFELEDYLFDKQLAFVKDPAPFKMATTTRRAGKSTSCVADLVWTAHNNPDTIGLYITLSRKNAKRLVWPEFKRINRQFNLGMEPNESDLSLTCTNGSMIYLLGAKDRGSIEDFRGLPIKKVYLDEAQSFPAYIRELIDDVIGPALMDYDGSLILIGTPGPVPAGYFFDLTRNDAWSHHFWSFFDNPHIAKKSGKTHQQLLDRELRRRGVAEDDPTIQREWFGQWITDENSLVYHYSELCDFDELPPLPNNGKWTYLLGVDLGFDDADALAVLAYSEAHPSTFLVEEIVTPNQDITALTAQIDVLRVKYDIAKIVIDTGGLGKKITEEISKRYKIPMVAAEKHRKFEYIALMNDAMRTGKLGAKRGSQFAQDCAKVEWDHDKTTPDKKVISKRFHSDICEAVLYIWRESYSYAHEAEKKQPKQYSKEWFEAEEDKMFQHELNLLEKQKELNEDPFKPDPDFNPFEPPDLD